jgi:hypothetical protein
MLVSWGGKRDMARGAGTLESLRAYNRSTPLLITSMLSLVLTYTCGSID